MGDPFILLSPSVKLCLRRHRLIRFFLLATAVIACRRRLVEPRRMHLATVFLVPVLKRYGNNDEYNNDDNMRFRSVA